MTPQPVSERLRSKLSQYRFEIRHIVVLFAVLIAFQIILAILQKSLLGDFLQGYAELVSEILCRKACDRYLVEPRAALPE